MRIDGSMLGHGVRRNRRFLLPAGVLTAIVLVTPVGAQSAAPAVLTAGASTLAGSVNAHALGLAESLLVYCSRVDPAAVATLQAKVALLSEGASEKALEQIRMSDEYQKARDTVDDFVTKVDAHNAKRVCSELPARNH